MSTRANIILREGNDKLYFYRHSDGYPDGAMPLLNKFREWIKARKIRNNLSQGAGWLILLGALEYQTIPPHSPGEKFEAKNLHSVGSPSDWKVGAIEPTTCIHGDIQYLYVVNVEDGEIDTYDKDFEKIDESI